MRLDCIEAAADCSFSLTLCQKQIATEKGRNEQVSSLWHSPPPLGKRYLQRSCGALSDRPNLKSIIFRYFFNFFLL